MTSLSTGLDSNHRYTGAEYNRWGYLSNGWGKMQRWDGLSSAIEDAGITGPSQEPDSWVPVPTTAVGDSTLGVHVFRYRYLDSKTGYVSDPSEEREATVGSAAEKLTFSIASAGTSADIVGAGDVDIDSKVDRIVLEATVAGGSLFFKVAEVANESGTTSVVFNISDANLQQRFLPWPDDGHQVPPIARYVVSHRERLWLFGQVTHAVGTATFTNASTDVAEGSTAPGWDADTLGDSTATPAKVGSVTWLVQRDGDAVAYEIDHFDASANKIVLTSAYAGVTGSNVAYKIFSRANVIWASNPSYPEGFTSLKFLTGPAGELSGTLTAGAGYGPVMVFFSLSGTYRLSWDQGPLVDPQLTPVSVKRGALNQRVVVFVEGVLYAMDNEGWHAYSGVFPRHISNDIDDLRDSIDYAQADAFHSVFIPELRAIRWYVCYSGDTIPKNFLQYDIDKNSWSTGAHEVGIQDSRLAPTSSGLSVYLGDENGHTWVGDTGTADGCIAAESHLTVGASATTTSIPVDETLGTTNEGLAGCMAYWVEGPADDGTDDGESRLISSNTASALTVAAFSEAPAQGDTIWVGRIPSKLKTRAFVAPRAGPKNVHRPRYCWLMFEPTSASRHLLVRMYDDYSSTAKTWGGASFRNTTGAVTPPGKDADIATTDWKIDMSTTGGVARIGLGEFVRSVEVEFEINEPDAEVEIFHVELDGEEGERSE